MAFSDQDPELTLIAQARPGPLLGIIGFVIASAGLAGAIVWPQMWMFSFRPVGFWQHVLPPIVSLFGLVAVPLGGFVAMGRLYAAIAAVPALIGLVLSGLAWTVYALLHGAFTPLYLFTVFGSCLGLAVSVVGVGLASRVHQARQALMAG